MICIRHTRGYAMKVHTPATIEDLYQVDGKAEPALPGWKMPFDDLFR